MASFGPSDILQHGEELKSILTRVAYATTQTLSESLNDQNRAVLAALGFVAALATGGLAVQIIKKKEEFNQIRGNIKPVPSDLLYDYPIFGQSLSFPTSPIDFWLKIGECYSEVRKRFPKQDYASLTFGPFTMIVPIRPAATEKIFRSQHNIYKGQFYQFFLPWLKTGLLTSTGAKWKDRRRLLTPAFHKHVLEDYLETMNEKADIMIKNIKTKIKTNKSIEIQKFITFCVLDIIVETAMGASSNLQSAGENDYLNAIYSVMAIIQVRQKSVWLWPDIVFKMTQAGQQFEKDLKILHDFTRDVIQQRWTDYKKKKAELGEAFESEYFGESKSSRKHRLSFLDTLLLAMDKDQSIDMEGCCEEVDTFMFEGHDTTSAAMTWTIQEIGNNQEVLKKCLAEIDEVFGDSDRPASIDDLNRLEYLDACIKESLRKFPSVPIFARQLTHDENVQIEDRKYFLSKGSLYVFPVYYLHRDPEHWDNPDEFRPERFLHGNADKRYAYSYTPFSAGSRNCIGQKFALLEEKVLISKMLRNFSWKSQRETNTIPVIAEIITRPENGCYIDLEQRKSS